MALFPSSATNEEVRLAIKILRENFTGHKFNFIRNKTGILRMGKMFYTVLPYAVCSDCGIRISWDTWAHYRKPGSNRWVSGSSKKIMDFPTCEHVKMSEALE